MNLIELSPLWLVGLFVLGVVAAAAEDARRLRISNITCAAVLVLALVAMGVCGPTLALWQNWLLFILILAIGTIAFSAGLLGGGDVKLLAVVALWVDLRSGLWLLSAILLAGGLVAIAYLLVGVVRGKAMKSSRHRRIPYGVAIAVGTLIGVALFRQGTPAPERPNPHAVTVPGEPAR